MAGELVFITGATGFVGFRVLIDALKAGYRVRAAVRRETAIDEIRGNPLIAPYLESLDFVIVKDITADGAFDDALNGVTYIAHLASPLPSAATTDLDKEIIEPALHGTTSILNSALRHPSIRRIVITNSIMGIMPNNILWGGDAENTYSGNSRVSPLPSAPWAGPGPAYASSKALALDATERFLEQKQPHFSVVSILPGFVVGRHELAKKSEDLLATTNIVVLAPVLGQTLPARPFEVVDVRDVARIHVEAFDNAKVVDGKAYILETGGEEHKFDDAIEVAKKFFPDAIEKGILPLGGHLPTTMHKLDIADTIITFGAMHSLEEAAKEAIGQYLELKAKETV